MYKAHSHKNRIWNLEVHSIWLHNDDTAVQTPLYKVFKKTKKQQQNNANVQCTNLD